MTGAAIPCSFSSGIDDMKRSEQKDPMKVLRVLAARPRFSAFEATDNMGIARSLQRLKDEGYITYPEPQPGYPWIRTELTDKARAALGSDGASNDRSFRC